MSWLDKVKAFFSKMLQGRNGLDYLGYCSLLTALIISVLASALRLGALSLVSTALYILTLFRILSRDTARRVEENRRFTAWVDKTGTSFRQSWTRLKNVRKFKYFRCPQCKSWLRLPCGAGSGTVTCSGCQHSFHAKA